MKGYALVKEHDSHFEVSHPEEGVFKVAKKTLDDRTLSRIRGLPKAMAEGGVVDEPPPAAGRAAELAVAAQQNPALAASTLSDSPLAKFIRGEIGWMGEQNPDYMPAQPAPKPAAVPALETTSAPASTDDKHASGTEAAASPNPNTAPLTRAGAAATAPQAPTAGTAPAGGGGFAMQEAGIKAAAKAEADASAEAAKVHAEGARQLQDLDTFYEGERVKLDAENAELQKRYGEGKIDPGRIWSQTSTGNKILAGIGVLLSGIGSGLTGQQNLALKVIDDAINRDIDAQKAALGKTQSLLSMNVEKYGRLDQAMKAAKANALSVTEAKVAEVAAKAKGPIAQANAQQLLGQLRTQREALQAQVVQGQVLGELASGQVPMTPAVAEKFFPGRWVNIPGAGVKVARTKESADKVAGAQASASTFGQLLDRMEAFAKAQGTVGTVRGSSANAEAQSLKTQALLQIKELGELGALSKSDIEDIIEPMLPDPGSMRSEKTTKQIGQLRQMTRDKLNAFYGAHLIGYDPAGVGASDRKVK